jgi:Ca2+-binding EF-hand superfamily protein
LIDLVSFDIFDMNGDGFIELQDLKSIAKSALLAALVLTNQYNLSEEEYARYAKEVIGYEIVNDCH